MKYSYRVDWREKQVLSNQYIREYAIISSENTLGHFWIHMLSLSFMESLFLLYLFIYLFFYRDVGSNTEKNTWMATILGVDWWKETGGRGKTLKNFATLHFWDFAHLWCHKLDHIQKVCVWGGEGGGKMELRGFNTKSEFGPRSLNSVYFNTLSFFSHTLKPYPAVLYLRESSKQSHFL